MAIIAVRMAIVTMGVAIVTMGITVVTMGITIVTMGMTVITIRISIIVPVITGTVGGDTNRHGRRIIIVTSRLLGNGNHWRCS